MSVTTLGIAGKGGAGKTTVAAGLARLAAGAGRRVVAVDADSDPDLALAAGCSPEEAKDLRPLLDQSGEDRHVPEGWTPERLLAEYAGDGPDGVRLVLAARAERAGSG